jgi:sugar lactone lactonase YvrE
MFALAAVVIIAAAAAAGSLAVWRWLTPAPVAPLERDWAAAAVVLAGDGVAGVLDGAAARARFSDPFGVATGPDGSIYVADAGEAQRIRRITPGGVVSTLAGSERGHADGKGGAARFDTPSALAIDASGVLFVADTANNAIRRVTPDGTVSTIAGDRTAGYRDGPANAAQFNGPVGIAVAADGRVIVADTYSDRIRAVRSDGVVSTLAGSGARGFFDGEALVAQFDTPSGVAVDGQGTIYVADTGNGHVRAISPTGVVSTIGPIPSDGLFRPIGIAVSGDGTALYVTDDRGRIVEITPGSGVRTLVGSQPGFADGAGREARFRGLAGLALAAPGRLIAADSRNALVRLVAARSRIGMHPLAPSRVRPRFDADGFARVPLLWPIAPMDGPFEIAGTLGEARGADGGERFHAGIDVRAESGTYVRAVRDGFVSSPIAASEFGTLNESVRIGSLTYVHLRVGRENRDDEIDPARFVAEYDDEEHIIHMRLKRGAHFSVGDVIGTVNAFNHVHLNVGWPGEEYNPLHFRLMNFEDTVPPTIARGGVRLFGEDGQPIKQRRKGRLVLDGRVQIVVDAWDQVDGNEPRRRLGLYRLGYQLLARDGSPAPGFEAPRETIRFDRLAGDAEAPRVVYAAGSGIPFYGRRSTHFLYVVTNSLHDGVSAAGMLDTSTLPPGDYTLRILASDIRNNVATANRDLPITVGARD